MSSLNANQIAALHCLPSMTGRLMSSLVMAGELSFPPTVRQWFELGAKPDQAAGLDQESTAINFERLADYLNRSGTTILTLATPDYPPLLREIPSPPPILYVRGHPPVLATTSLAVVGTRQATEYGLATTKSLVEAVGRFGLTIVSGLAFGIDAVAHQSALRVGAPTVAVLGSGLDVIYPWPHRDLVEEIIAGGGAVISEFPLGAKPERHHFPQRNRIISGLSRAVLLVEAGEKSGALITAKFAVDQNREVLAVPGLISSPQSIGPHNWLKLGAKLVTRAEDILEVFTQLHFPQKSGAGFSMTQANVPDVTAVPTSTDPIESIVLELLTGQPCHVDEIIRKSRLDTSVVTTTISLLEIRGLIEHIGGMNYRLI